MSVVDKLRAAKDFVTGGGADVTVRILGSARRGVPLQLEVQADVKANPIPIQRVYVTLRATFFLEYQSDLDGSPARMRETRRDFEAQLEHVEEQVLEAGKSALWTLEYTFPEALKPTSASAHTRYVWEMCAYLDKAGNDPDSGWVGFVLE